MKLRRLATISLLAALSVALRHAFAAFPNVKPITAIFLVLSVLLGLTDSLLVMALTMMITGFFMGVGPVIFGQVLSYGLVLIFWKFLCFPLTNNLKSATIRLIVQSILAGLMGVLYGWVIDSLWALLANLPLWATVLAGTAFNLAHAISTALFYPIIDFSLARLKLIIKKRRLPMKRLPLGMLALLASLSLVACTPKANTSASSAAQSSQEARKTLELTVVTEAGLTSKTVAFKEGQSVMDLLKENFEVKEDNGLVTAIDGLEQQPAKNIYWMYEVNGSLADKGAAEFYPEAGDTIKFYQEQF